MSPRRPADPAADAAHRTRFLRRAALLLVGLIGVVLSVKAHDSGIIKMPLFVLGGLLLASLLPLRVSGIRPPVVRLAPAEGALVLLLLTAAAGWIRTIPAPGSADGMLFLVACAGFMAAGSRLWESRGHLEEFGTALTILSIPVVLAGILQYTAAEALPVEFYLDEHRRVGSLLGSPAFLAGFIVIALPFVAAGAVDRRSKLSASARGILAAGLVVLLFLTGSRSGLAGAAVGGVVFLVLRPPAGARRMVPAFLLGGALLLALAVALLPDTAHRFLTAFDQGASSTWARRLFFWDAGVRAFLAAPVAGHGPGSFERVIGAYRDREYWTARSEDIVPHAHNELLETAVDLGAVGAACVIVILVSALWRAGRAARLESGTAGRWGAAAAAALAGIVVDNLANVSLRQAPVAATVWLLLGILHSPALAPVPALRRKLPLRIPHALRAVPLLAWCALAAWYVPRALGELRASADLIEALLRTRAGDQTGAEAAYRSAVGHAPHFWLARSHLAASHIQTSRFADALREVGDLQRGYPEYPRTWLARGIALWRTGDTAGALHALARERGVRSHPEVYYIESLVHRTRRDTAAEAAALDSVLHACARGGITQHLAYAALRLPAVAREDMRRKLDSLYGTLARVFPDDSAVTAGWEELRRTVRQR